MQNHRRQYLSFLTGSAHPRSSRSVFTVSTISNQCIPPLQSIITRRLPRLALSPLIRGDTEGVTSAAFVVWGITFQQQQSPRTAPTPSRRLHPVLSPAIRTDQSIPGRTSHSRPSHPQERQQRIFSARTRHTTECAT